MSAFNRSCDKCDCYKMCIVRDANNCPYDDIKVCVGEPFNRTTSNMSDHEAANILRRFVSSVQFPRGNAKNTQTLKLTTAIIKGIEALEKR